MAEKQWSGCLICTVNQPGLKSLVDKTLAKWSWTSYIILCSHTAWQWTKLKKLSETCWILLYRFWGNDTTIISCSIFQLLLWYVPIFVIICSDKTQITLAACIYHTTHRQDNASATVHNSATTLKTLNISYSYSYVLTQISPIIATW